MRKFNVGLEQHWKTKPGLHIINNNLDHLSRLTWIVSVVSNFVTDSAAEKIETTETIETIIQKPGLTYQ